MKILLTRLRGKQGFKRHIPWHYGFYKDLLETEGHTFDFIDNQVEEYTVQELVDIVLDNNYSLACVSGVAFIYNDLKVFVELLKAKRKDILVVVGGHVVADHEFILNSCPVDIVVFGEGEVTIPKIVSCIEANDSLDAVPGIAFKKDNEVFLTEREKQYAVMDDLPLVNPESFKLDKYNSKINAICLIDENAIRFKEEGHKAASFIASRGCTHTCFFCYRHQKGYRSYSKGRLEENIKVLKDSNYSFLLFSDELMTADEKRLKDLCGLMKKYGIYWIGSGRANQITIEIVEMLKESNCCQFFVGVESFDPKMLKQMYKKVTPQQNITAVNMLYQYGIFCRLALIIGVPGEDRQTIYSTRQGLWSCYFFGDIIDCAYLSPFPGSPSYYFGLKNGYIKDARYVHEELIEKNDLVINFSKLSNLELAAWHNWLYCEAAISHRVKHYALNIDQPFLIILKEFLISYSKLLFKEPVNFLMLNLYILKGFNYWLKPVKKLKWAEFRETLLVPKRLSLRRSLKKRLRRIFATDS
jgi:radical SAM superfamily enzyme YgiQ (UPF0313 family)